jgi:hypothetical protein
LAPALQSLPDGNSAKSVDIDCIEKNFTLAIETRVIIRSHSLAILRRAGYRASKYECDEAILIPLAEAVKTVLDQEGKPDLPLDRVVDPTIVEEVLRERR